MAGEKKEKNLTPWPPFEDGTRKDLLPASRSGGNANSPLVAPVKGVAAPDGRRMIPSLPRDHQTEGNMFTVSGKNYSCSKKPF